MNDQQSVSHLTLTVVPGKLSLFTTVLQSGIEIMTPAGTSLGQFLSALPGFSAEYLANTVQTIFHNGIAVDDLTTVFAGDRPVLALSAAMPGLAGAIFRKNSFHAALRSEIKGLQAPSHQAQLLVVTLKLINTIAQDRGKELFGSGVSLPTEVLSSFLNKRPNLIKAIVGIRLEGKDISLDTLMPMLTLPLKINLKILEETTIAHG